MSTQKDKKNYLPVQPQPVGISRTIVRVVCQGDAGTPDESTGREMPGESPGVRRNRGS